MRVLLAVCLAAAMTARADDDWFEDWQSERAAERRHEELLSAIGEIEPVAPTGAIYVAPAPPPRATIPVRPECAGAKTHVELIECLARLLPD